MLYWGYDPLHNMSNSGDNVYLTTWQVYSTAVLNPWAADQRWALTGNVVGRAEVLKQYKKVRQFL